MDNGQLWKALEGESHRQSWALEDSRAGAGAGLGQACPPQPAACPHLRKVPTGLFQLAASRQGRQAAPLPPHSQGARGVRSAETGAGGEKGQGPGDPGSSDTALPGPRVATSVIRDCLQLPDLPQGPTQC